MKKTKTDKHRAWIRKTMRRKKLTSNELYKRLTDFHKKPKSLAMKEKKLNHKQYVERRNFIGECLMLLEVEDFQKST